MLKIEFAYRECYKSEGRMAEVPNIEFIRNKINIGHLSPLEHVAITVEIICDRGVSHELVRHRLASYSQESTRYCNYSGNGLTVIEPCFWDPSSFMYRLPDGESVEATTAACREVWYELMKASESAYNKLIALKATPQEARSVLPNSTKTAIVVTQNIRQWRHFFQLRALGMTGKPHPQMIELALPMLTTFKKDYFPLFENLQKEDV